MHSRSAQRYAFAPRLPKHVAVGEFALARNFGGTFLAVRVEDRGEQDRHRFDRPFLHQAFHFLPMQVGERRDEIEIPANGKRRVHPEAIVQRTAAGYARGKPPASAGASARR